MQVQQRSFGIRGQNGKLFFFPMYSKEKDSYFRVKHDACLICIRGSVSYTRMKHGIDNFCYTVVPAKSDSNVMFCLHSDKGLRVDRSLVY